MPCSAAPSATSEHDRHQRRRSNEHRSRASVEVPKRPIFVEEEVDEDAGEGRDEPDLREVVESEVLGDGETIFRRPARRRDGEELQRLRRTGCAGERNVQMRLR